MAILINGNGNPAIYPDQDADWFASIFGGQTAITGVGSQFAAEIQDANTIALADGVIITKEGRRIQLDANQSDIFEIPTGAQGTTNYYIIGYCLTTNDDSFQTAETFVELMENATDTIEEDTFRDGADKVYVSLYRVTQTGFTLETPELLLPQVGSITQLNADLSDKVSGFTDTTYDAVTGLAYDSTNKKLGLKVGADTVIPFSGEQPFKGALVGMAGGYSSNMWCAGIKSSGEITMNLYTNGSLVSNITSMVDFISSGSTSGQFATYFNVSKAGKYIWQNGSTTTEYNLNVGDRFPETFWCGTGSSSGSAQYAIIYLG